LKIPDNSVTFITIQSAVELVDKFLALDPAKRISAKDALDSDYFWEEPLPCKPSQLPKYEPSHEFQTRKRRQARRFDPVPIVNVSIPSQATSVTYVGSQTQLSVLTNRVTFLDSVLQEDVKRTEDAKRHVSHNKQVNEPDIHKGASRRERYGAYRSAVPVGSAWTTSSTSLGQASWALPKTDE